MSETVSVSEQENSDQAAVSADDPSTAARPDSEDNEKDNGTTDSPRQVTYTPRFTAFIVVIGALTIAGLLTFNPAAIGGAIALLIFLAATLVHTPTQTTGNLSVEYTIAPERPHPSEHVEIEVTLTNTSNQTFADLRLIDLVPDELQVVGGTPRAAQPLRPDETITINYDVIATRGSYSFGTIATRSRGLMGTMWIEETIHPETPVELRCAVNIDDIPLEDQATNYIGSLLGDTGGEGIEFHSTREYHRGDSPSRIHWRELAKRGELSTVTYREQQTGHITIIADIRPRSRVKSPDGTISSTTIIGYATYQLTASLVADRHFVGIAVPGTAAGPIDEKPTMSFRTYDHDNSRDQRKHAFQLLEIIENTQPRSDGDLEQYRIDRGNFPTGTSGGNLFDTQSNTTIDSFIQNITTWGTDATQYIFITPLLDDDAYGVCTQLSKRGYPITVISPDIGANRSADATDIAATRNVPERMKTVRRASRIESLRRTGITVIDWDPNVPLSTACERQTLPGEL